MGKELLYHWNCCAVGNVLCVAVNDWFSPVAAIASISLRVKPKLIYLTDVYVCFTLTLSSFALLRAGMSIAYI